MNIFTSFDDNFASQDAEPDWEFSQLCSDGRGPKHHGGSDHSSALVYGDKGLVLRSPLPSKSIIDHEMRVYMVNIVTDMTSYWS